MTSLVTTQTLLEVEREAASYVFTKYANLNLPNTQETRDRIAEDIKILVNRSLQERGISPVKPHILASPNKENQSLDISVNWQIL